MKTEELISVFVGRRTSQVLTIVVVLLVLDTQVLGDAANWVTQCSKLEPNCTCKFKDGLNFANCSERSLTGVPQGDLSEFQSIDLSYNHIVTVYAEEFSRSKLKNLKRLGLSHNLIRDVQPKAFLDLNVLTSLDLSHNQLDKIDPAVFEPLKSLTSLKLDGNRLYTFKDGAFPPLGALIELSLSSNLFERLSPGVFQRLYSLTTLELADNPWKCDCHLRDFHNWVTERKLLSKTACNSTAPSIKATTWDLMSSNDFICRPVITAFRVNENYTDESETSISVEAETGLQIECHIEGDPMPVLTWFKDGGTVLSWKRDPAPVIKNDQDCPERNTTCSKLILPGLNSEDSGRFACMGENAGGRERRIVRIAVIGGTSPVVLIGGSSKTWLWILLGLLGFILLIAIIVTLSFCFLRRKKQNQRKRVGDISAEYQKKPAIPDQTDDGGAATSPLITKSEVSVTTTTTPVDSIKYPQPVTNGFSGARAGTPMPQQGPDYVVPQHGSLRRLPPYLSGSQILVPQEIYHPGGYATYDPRHGPLYGPVFRQQPQYPIYGRLQSPFSGSVASFTSEPPARILPGPGYVTLPRRRRVPSWSPANYASGARTPVVPPSPTPSLPVPNLKARYNVPSGPRYDTVGPRTTADGGSNLSLNKVGIAPTPTRTHGGLLTPGTPASPADSVFSRGPSTPLGGRIPKGPTVRPHYKPITPTQFNFDTIVETEDPPTPTVNDTPWSFPDGKPSESDQVKRRRPDSLKIPPQPPAKPKRKSANFDEQQLPTPISNIQGTEV